MYIKEKYKKYKIYSEATECLAGIKKKKKNKTVYKNIYIGIYIVKMKCLIKK